MCNFGSANYFVGFYFGYKNKEARESQNSLLVSNKPSTASLETEKLITAGDLKDIPEVYWIRSGEEPVCPQSHPIKGKFDSAVNLYYTKENKFYDRVKPNLCFVHEVFAKDIAGFVKKF
jgi:hypothetical protein